MTTLLLALMCSLNLSAADNLLERNHGEPDPKTDYYIRRCYDATYAVKATTITLATGDYLCLGIIEVR